MGKRKKKKNLKYKFYKHDFEVARTVVKKLGVDLVLDIRACLQNIQEQETTLNETTVSLSPWMGHMCQQYAAQRMSTLDLRRDYLRWVMFHWRGQQNFRLWPQLCEALAATEFRCPRELLKLPYVSFSLQVPREVGDWYHITHQDGTSFPAATIYVSEAIAVETQERALSITFISAQPSNPQQKGNVYHFLLPLHQPALPEILDEEWALASDTTDDMGLSRNNRECLRLVLNTLLYITTPQADVVVKPSNFETMVQAMSANAKPSQKERRVRALAEQSMLRHHETGRKVRIPNMSLDGNTGQAGTFKIRHRFLVRGHWRNQAVGPKRAERRLTWIQPFYKGSGLPEIPKRTYEVDQR